MLYFLATLRWESPAAILSNTCYNSDSIAIKINQNNSILVELLLLKERRHITIYRGTRCAKWPVVGGGQKWGHDW